MSAPPCTARSLTRMRMRRRGSVLAAVLAVSAAAARPAHADDALARQYFRHGIELYDKKQFEPALAQFRAAYAEKASPGIKQNIALCLEGLGRPVEAATAFDEALDEGATTLKPEIRAAMEKELGELAKVVATVRLRVVSSDPSKPAPPAAVTVTVDGAALSPSALRRPIRLEPGIHVFTAHADGFADPAEKKLSLLAGSPVDATFELGAAGGALTIKPNVAESVIHVDGVVVGRGTWSGRLPAGPHRVSVTAEGFQITNADIVVTSGTTVEYPITLIREPEPPPEYLAPRKPVRPPKMRYLVPAVAYEEESFRLGTVLGESPGGTKRSFTGGSFGVRGGLRVSHYFAVELYGEVGQVSESYTIDGASGESTTKITNWQVTPALRFASTGPVRFMVGTGFGVHGLVVESAIHPSSTSSSVGTTHKGSGASASWLADIGLQFDVGPLFLEAAGFVDVHGIASVKDNDSGERFFLSSPNTRAGVRVGLGIPF